MPHATAVSRGGVHAGRPVARQVFRREEAKMTATAFSRHGFPFGKKPRPQHNFSPLVKGGPGGGPAELTTLSARPQSVHTDFASPLGGTQARTTP